MGAPSPKRPLGMLATWFGTGLLPRIPGTWGSLGALPPVALLHWATGRAGLAVFVTTVTVLGVLLAGRYARAAGASDPQAVVIDEVAGQSLTLLAAPLTVPGYAAAFMLFRAGDSIKPWPLRRLERLPFGWGIMADDLGAGVMAGGVVAVLNHGAGWV